VGWQKLWTDSWQGQVILFFLLQAFRLAATYSMGSKGSFTRDKGAGVQVLPLTPSSWWVKGCRELYCHFPCVLCCVAVHKTPGHLYLLHLFCWVTYSVHQFQLYFMWLHVCDTWMMLQVWFSKFMHSIIWQPARHSLRLFPVTAGRATLTPISVCGVSVSNRFFLTIFMETMKIVSCSSQHTSHVKHVYSTLELCWCN
jgi:hypothetical protein